MTITTDARNLSCIGSNFFLTWEPVFSKLVVRPLSTIRLQSSNDSVDEIELSLSLVPPFHVNEVSLNVSETHLFLAGSEGVVVVLLPVDQLSRPFPTKNEDICCSSYILDRSVYCSSKLRIRQVKWLQKSHVKWCHNSDLGDLIISILLSDGHVRLYNLLTSPVDHIVELKLRHTNNGSFSDLLGDQIISFDCFPVLDNAFTVVCLTQNGDVFIKEGLQCNSLMSCDGWLTGPLTILPEAEDNYGDDFVEIFCLQYCGFDCLALMNANEDILHCVVLPSNEENNSSGSSEIEVLERVRFTKNPAADKGSLINEVNPEQYSNVFVAPLYSSSPFAYYFWNKAGVFLVEAECFLILKPSEASFSGTNDATDLHSSINQKASSTWCLVSTTCSSQESDNDGTIISVTYLADINTLLCTSQSLSTFSVNIDKYIMRTSEVTLPVLTLNTSLDIAKHPRGNLSAPRPFLPCIQKMLRESKRIPKLSLGTSKGSPTEVYELSKKIVNDFREKRYNVLCAVNDELKKRVSLINQRLSNQIKEISELSKQRASLVDQIRLLAEKNEFVNSQQEVLESSAEVLSRSIYYQCSVTSHAEEQLLKKLKASEVSLEQRRRLINSLQLSSMKADTITHSGGAERESSHDDLNRSVHKQNLMKTSMIHKLVAQEAQLLNDLVSQINAFKNCFSN